MAKNNEKKIALALACVQVLGGRALAKDQLKKSQIGYSNGSGALKSGVSRDNQKSGGWFENLSGLTKFALLSSGAAASAGLGALGYHLVNYAKTKQNEKIFIKCLKYFKVRSICFNIWTKYFSDEEQKVIDLNIADNYKKITNCKSKNSVFNNDIFEFKYKFYDYYFNYFRKLQKDFLKIASKYCINISVHECQGWIEYRELYANVCNKNNKLYVEFLHKVNNKTLNVTHQFNIENPVTDEEKRKKAFYDELTEYFNNDNVMKQVLLSD